MEEDRKTQKLSGHLWGLDWSRYFPLSVVNSPYSFQVTGVEAAFAFMRENWARINQDHERGEDNPFQAYSSSGSTPVKSRESFYQVLGDFISIHHRQEMVGLFTGNALDWESYYFRSIAILPEHQGKKLLQNLMAALIPILKLHNVARIETDISPSNLGQAHLLTKFKFNITGMNQTDRWGTQIRFTRFLNEKGLEIFLRQFCYGVTPQLRTKGGGRGDET